MQVISCLALSVFLATTVLAHSNQLLSANNPQCGQVCPFGNNNCSANPSCSRCNGPGGFNGICVKGYACGQSCESKFDCDQTTNCTECLAETNTCAAACGMPCGADAQCGSTCNKCVGGQCQLWMCGKSCSASNPCVGPCASCVNGTCTTQCGSVCLSSADCPQNACPDCLNGICQSQGKCKSVCNDNSQCTGDPNCNLCVSGRCAAGCLAKCTSTTFCGEPGCGTCVQGLCKDWACGKHCDPAGCSPPCVFCGNGTCISQCGSFCLKNSDCPGTCGTCSGNKCT